MYFDSSGSSASATTSRHSSSLGSPPPAPSGGGRQPKATLIHDSPPPPPPAPPPTGSPPSGAHFRPGAGNGTSGQPPISPTTATATGPGRSFPPPPAALNILQPVVSKRDSNSSLKGNTTPTATTATDTIAAMSTSGSMPNTPSGRGVNRSASSTSFPLRIASFKGGSNPPSPAVVNPMALFNERLEGVVRDMTRANEESSASTSISSAKDVENSLLLDLLPRVSSPAEFPTVDMRSSIDTLYSSSDGSAPTQANFEKLKELTLRLYDMSRQFYLEMQQQQQAQGMSSSDRADRAASSILAGSGSGRSPRNNNRRPRIIQPPADVREASVVSASGSPAMLNRVMSEVFTNSQGPGRAFNLPSTTSWLHKGKQLAHSASVASLGGYGGERRRTVARTKATRETDDFGIDHLAQYEIIAELGKGNYGSVCLALDEEGNSVAIKTMHRGNRLRTTVPSHALIPGPPSESSQSSQASDSVSSNPMQNSSSNPNSPATIMVAAAGGEGEEQSRPLTITGFTNPPAATGENGEGEESMRNLSMTQVPAGLNGQVANWESSENSEEESADSIARSDPRKLSTPSSDSSGMGDVQRTNIFAQGQNPSAGALTIESTNSQSSQSLLLPSPSSRTGTTNSTGSDNPLGDKRLSKRTTAAATTNTTTNSTTTGKTVLTRSDTQQRLVNDLPLGCIEREIALMKRLRHKNVVQLFEVIDDEETETTHMVMQYVENGPIVKLKDDGTCQPLPIKEALDLMVQVSAGLDYLHRHGIAHRDIKPDNILIGKDKTAHLADFGVSGWLVNTQTGQKPTKAGAAVGTMAFQSPEVVRGDSIQFEKEADIWAYGVTLYLCLYGRLPFAGDTGPRIYKAILNEEVEFPEDGDAKLRAEGVPQHLIDSLKDLVVKLLKKKPEDRIKLREFRHHPVIEEILGKKTEDSAQNVTFKPPAMSRNVTQNENLDEMLQMLSDLEAGKKPPPTSSSNTGTAEVVPMPTFLVDSTPSSFSGNLKGGSNSLLGPGSPELGPKHTTHVFLGAGDSNNKSKMNLSSTQAPSTLPQAPDHLLWKQGESVDSFHGVQKVTSDSNMGSSGKRGGGGGGYDVTVPPALQQGKRASGSSTQSGASGANGGLKSPTTSGGKTVSFDGAMDHRLSVISETSSSRRSSASNSVKDQAASPVIPPPVIVSSRPPLPFSTQAGGQTQQQQKTSGSNHSLNSQKSSAAPSETTSTVSSENLAVLQKQHQPPGILQLNPPQGETSQTHNMQSPESEASSTQTRAWRDDSRSTPATTTTTGGADPSFSPDSTTQNQQVLVGAGSSFNHPGDLQIPTFEMTDEDLLSAVSRRTVTLSRRVNTLTAQSNALVGGFVHKLRNKVNRRRVGTAGGSRRGGRPRTMGGSSINQQLDASGRGERPNSASHHRPSGDDVTDQKGTRDLVVAGSHIHLTKSPAVAGSLALHQHHHHHNNNTPSGPAPPISHQEMSGGDFYYPEDDGPRPLSESFEGPIGTIKSNNKTNSSRNGSVSDIM